MGLDMYLIKKTYVGANYEHNRVTGKIELIKEGKKLPIIQKRVTNVTENVGYWRKANHIHNWFVKNVQNNVDDCGDYYVSVENLTELLSACKAVKENELVASDILPTNGGFFFGGVEYDTYYMEDIYSTIEMIEGLLIEDNSYSDFYYYSSW